MLLPNMKINSEQMFLQNSDILHKNCGVVPHVHYEEVRENNFKLASLNPWDLFGDNNLTG